MLILWSNYQSHRLSFQLGGMKKSVYHSVSYCSYWAPFVSDHSISNVWSHRRPVWFQNFFVIAMVLAKWRLLLPWPTCLEGFLLYVRLLSITDECLSDYFQMYFAYHRRVRLDCINNESVIQLFYRLKTGIVLEMFAQLVRSIRSADSIVLVKHFFGTFSVKYNERNIYMLQEDSYIV